MWRFYTAQFGVKHYICHVIEEKAKRRWWNEAWQAKCFTIQTGLGLGRPQTMYFMDNKSTTGYLNMWGLFETIHVSWASFGWISTNTLLHSNFAVDGETNWLDVFTRFILDYTFYQFFWVFTHSFIQEGSIGLCLSGCSYSNSTQCASHRELDFFFLEAPVYQSKMFLVIVRDTKSGLESHFSHYYPSIIFLFFHFNNPVLHLQDIILLLIIVHLFLFECKRY